MLALKAFGIFAPFISALPALTPSVVQKKIAARVGVATRAFALLFVRPLAASQIFGVRNSLKVRRVHAGRISA
jgi:hypothetical protein